MAAMTMVSRKSIAVTLLLLLSQPITSSAKNELFVNPNLPNDVPISANEHHDDEMRMSMSMYMSMRGDDDLIISSNNVPVPEVEVSQATGDNPNPNDTNDVPNPNLAGDDDTTSTTTSSGGDFPNPNLMTARPTRKPTRRPTKEATDKPSPSPTYKPTRKPTRKPTQSPTPEPTNAPVTKAPITTYPNPNEENEMGGSNPTLSPDNDPDDGTGAEGGVVPVASPDDKDEPTLSPTPEPTKSPVTAEEAVIIAAACDGLVNGTSPNVSSALNYTYEVTLGTTDSDDVESVIDNIEKTLKLYVGVQLFGCNEPDRRRRMKSAGTAMGIHGFPSERVLDGETCEIPSDDCFVASGGMALIMNNGTSTEDAEASTLDALKIIHEAMNVQNPSPFVAGEKYGVASVKGVGFLQGTAADGATIDKEGAVTTDRGTTITEATAAQSNFRLSTGGIVALSLCLLALLAALILLTMRKRSTFKELQNEDGDSDSDVFDDVSMDDDTLSLQSPRKKRAYIVGEEESVYTRDTKVCTPEGWPSDEEGVEITNERMYPLRMGKQTKFISAFDDGREVSVLPFENPGAIRRRSLIEDTVDL